MSSPLIFSAPTSLPPEETASAFTGMTLTWEGPDGSMWDFSDNDGGVVLASDGIEGLHFPRIQRHTSRSRTVPGQRLRGWRTDPREAFWPLLIWGDSSDEWLERHRAFFDTIHPEHPGTWRVTAGRETRSLLLTGSFDDPAVYDRDPALFGWSKEPVTLIADQPYWRGATIRRGPWRSPEAVPFFPGPPFPIASSAAFGSASIPNPGDVDAYGVWWAVGPLSSVELGVGTAIILPPFGLADGETLRIDTDPREPTAQRGPTPLNEDGELDTRLFVGEDATRDLGMQSYAAVPPGAAVDLHVGAVGAGAVIFDLTPLHFRAF